MNNPAQLTRYKKVLLIDDDAVDNYISGRIIKSSLLSENIVLVSSAEEGLHYLKKTSAQPDELPEIIFLDVSMPGMDGFDFLHEFNLLGEMVKKHCRIVILSNSFDPDPGKATSARNNPLVYKVFSKPLTVELLEKI